MMSETTAFAMLTATILPIYFNYLAKKSGTFLPSRLTCTYVGLCRFQSCTLLNSAISGNRIFGGHCRCQGSESKKLFVTFSFASEFFGCAMLGFIPSWFFFLYCLCFDKYRVFSQSDFL